PRRSSGLSADPGGRGVSVAAEPLSVLRCVALASFAAAVVGLAGRWRPPPGRLRALGRPAGPHARPGPAGRAVAGRAVVVSAVLVSTVVAAGLAHPLLGGLLAVAALGRAPVAARPARRRAAAAVEAA